MFTTTPVNAQRARRARHRNLFLPAEQTPPVLPTTGPPSFSYGSSNASFERPLDYAAHQQQQQSNVTTRRSYALKKNRKSSEAAVKDARNGLVTARSRDGDNDDDEEEEEEEEDVRSSVAVSEASDQSKSKKDMLETSQQVLGLRNYFAMDRRREFRPQGVISNHTPRQPSSELTFEYSKHSSDFSKDYEEEEALYNELRKFRYQKESQYVTEEEEIQDYSESEVPDVQITPEKIETRVATTINYVNSSGRNLVHILSLPFSMIGRLRTLFLRYKGAILLLIAVPLFALGLWQAMSHVLSHPSSRHPYSPPKTTPENFEEWIQRLRQLEQQMQKHSQKGIELSGSFENEQNAFKAMQFHLRDLENSVKNLALRGENEQVHAANLISSLDQQYQDIARDLSSLKGLLQDYSLQLDQQSQNIYQIDTNDRAGLVDAFNRIDQLTHELADLRRTALQIQDVDSFSRLLSGALESQLPQYLAVQVDPTTRKVSISPEFWIALERKLNTQNKTDAPASWDGFIAQNEASIDAYFNHTLSGVWKDTLVSGGVVSRDEFLSVIQREIEGANDDLSRRLRRLETSANYPPSSSSDQAIKIIVDAALRKYSSSICSKKDFALSSAGALINPYLTSHTFTRKPATWPIGKRALSWLFGGKGRLRGHPPAIVLHPQTATGNCWSFKGSTGHLGVRLSRSIFPTDVTIEHVDKEAALDVTSAPRDIEVWASVPLSEVDALRTLSQNLSAKHIPIDFDMDEFSLASKIPMIRVASFTYDITTDHNVQSFPITIPIRRLNIHTRQLVFRFLNNWGNGDYTCVYRVQVHGVLFDNEDEFEVNSNRVEEDRGLL